MNQPDLVMGAVAYAPKVVTIWEGFKAWFHEHDLKFDYILYSNYEAQVEAQFDGSIHIAWNSPLAWIRADRIARSRGQSVQAVAMRDTDRDLRSVIVTHADGPVQSIADLRGRIVGVGSIDSPQATLIPLHHLRSLDLIDGRDFKIRRFDEFGGKHGDHIGGEREAAFALLRGEIDAACMIADNLLAFGLDGTLLAVVTRVISQTELFDHCNFTTSPDAPGYAISQFVDLLLSMRWDDPQVRPLLELEGLKQWLPGRTSGYAALKRAVDEDNFYGPDGSIRNADYRY